MAIGFLECAGYGAVLYAMDRACKAADIEIIGIDTINPKDASAFIPLTAQVKFAGSVDDVKVACEVARRAGNRPDGSAGHENRGGGALLHRHGYDGGEIAAVQ